MDLESINLKDIKEMRQERHWSQDQLAEMSGLSRRTIQRIENGENAGLESMKALAAVFEINIVDRDAEMEQVRIEEEYVQKIKGFYNLLAVAAISLLVPLILVITDTSNWQVLLWLSLSWAVLLVVYSLNSFDFFGEEWKKNLIKKRFKR